MNPYLRIKQALGSKRPAGTGAIVSVDGETVRVQLPGGIVQASAPGGGFAVGNEVMVSDGIVRSRVKPEASVPIYRV